MNTYISLLRGINVSGQKKIKMEALKTVYQNAGLNDVTTYIQSGNVIFKSSESDSDRLADMIEQSIKDEFGYPVFILIRKKEDLEKILKINPFLKIETTDAAKLHVTFLFGEPQSTRVVTLNEFKSARDTFQVIGREIFVYCPDGYGQTKLSNTFFEKKLSLSATTRNWKTVNTLVDMAK
jgi:uncharacterized protein (DUF1697 family)